MTEIQVKQIEIAAELIETKVNELHADFHTGKWNPVCGQWLVYGFERKLGFIGAAEFEAKIERAYRAKKSVKQAVIEFFKGEIE